MNQSHEPNNDFVERLGWQVRLEARRRNRMADARGGRGGSQQEPWRP